MINLYHMLVDIHVYRNLLEILKDKNHQQKYLKI